MKRRMLCAAVVNAFVLAAFTLPAAAAQPLPRVFFSPQERPAIVAHRRTGARPDASVAVVAEPAPVGGSPRSESMSPAALRLEGISLARSGGHFAWIDGKRYADHSQFGSYQLRISSGGVDFLRAGAVARRLRVGETLGRSVDVKAAQ